MHGSGSAAAAKCRHLRSSTTVPTLQKKVSDIPVPSWHVANLFPLWYVRILYTYVLALKKINKKFAQSINQTSMARRFDLLGRNPRPWSWVTYVESLTLSFSFNNKPFMNHCVHSSSSWDFKKLAAEQPFAWYGSPLHPSPSDGQGRMPCWVGSLR